jgi:RNA polymerase-binding transcription factor
MTTLATRNARLRDTLLARRDEVRADVQRRIRDGRTTGPSDVHDTVDRADTDSERDIELALLQMRSETQTSIDEALGRLDAGKYGSCVECADEIAERRLRALPFAVRCQACEERRELRQGRARQLACQRATLPLFSAGVTRSRG